MLEKNYLLYSDIYKREQQQSIPQTLKCLAFYILQL